jgi:Mrp family chromosome partitioning ATPase
MKRVPLALVLIVAATLAGAAGYLVSGRVAPVFEAALVLVAGADVAGAADVASPGRAATDYLAAAIDPEVLHEALTTMGVSAPTARDAMALRSLTHVSVTTSGGDHVLTVRGRDASPERARARVGALAAALVAWDATTRRAYVGDRVEALEREIAALGERIRVLQTLDDATAPDRLDALMRERVALQAEAQGALAARVTGGGLALPQPVVASTRTIPRRPLADGLIAASASAALAYLAALLAGEEAVRRRRERGLGGLGGLGGLRVLSTFPGAGAEPSRLREAGSALMMSLRPEVEEAQRGVFVVASARTGEGASTVAVQLAEAFARDGYLTLLVDGDLYGPSIAARFGIEQGRAGVDRDRPAAPSTAAGWFADPAGDHQVARIGSHERLHVVPQFAPAPLGTHELAAGLGDALRRWAGYDVIVIAAAPLSAAADAPVIAGHCTGAVWVVDRSRSERRRSRSAPKALPRHGGRVLGVVWTNYVAASGVDAPAWPRSVEIMPDPTRSASSRPSDARDRGEPVLR